MTDDEFKAWIAWAPPERLESVAELVQADAWRMMAAGDVEKGTRFEGIAAMMRLLAEQRRAP
jgi:hypothetical protein